MFCDRPLRRAAFCLLALMCPCLVMAADPSRPNVIFILSDDQGRMDYSACGTKDIRTPGIDRLMREGMELRNFYANSCVCSPTRAALLTGRYPDRAGVPGVIRHTPANSWGRLADSVPLLPQVLHAAGYHSAIVGKWHLGLTAPDTPGDRGFDHFQGFLGDMMDDYWTHRRGGQNFMRLNREVIDPQGHATDLFTRWACEYLASRAGQTQPFFLYLAFNAPHDPIQPPPEVVDAVRRREPGMTEKRAKLVALIEHMDSGIQQVLTTLDRLKLTENTLVMFSSDNGGVRGYEANNGPWRSDKQHMYEGGLRVPFAARWPGHIAAGSTSDRVALTMDAFATICEAAGATAPEDIDGVSFLPALLGTNQPEADRDLYFVRREGGPAYGGLTIQALRHGDWKLIQDSPYQPLELYNLRDDPQETTNRAATDKARVRELQSRLSLHLQRGGHIPWQAGSP